MSLSVPVSTCSVCTVFIVVAIVYSLFLLFASQAAAVNKINFVHYDDQPLIHYRRTGDAYESDEPFVYLELPVKIKTFSNATRYTIRQVKISSFIQHNYEGEKNIGDLLYRFDTGNQSAAMEHAFVPMIKTLITPKHSDAVHDCLSSSTPISLPITVEIQATFEYGALDFTTTETFLQQLAVCCTTNCGDTNNGTVVPSGDVANPTEIKQAFYSGEYTRETTGFTVIDGPQYIDD